MRDVEILESHLAVQGLFGKRESRVGSWRDEKEGMGVVARLETNKRIKMQPDVRLLDVVH